MEKPAEIVDLRSIAKRLRELRARVALTQFELAAEVGIKPLTFQTWEEATSETSPENYARLARWYSERLDEKISWEWIFFGLVPGVDVQQMRMEWREEMANQLTALRETLRAEITTEVKAELGLTQHPG